MKTALLTVALCLLASAPLQAEVRWSLDFKLTRVGTITVDGTEGPGNYLYATLEVSNEGNDRDAPLRLSIDVLTDVTGRRYRAGFDPIVHRVLEKRLGAQFNRLSEITGTLGDGESAQCLVTFGKIDPNVDRFTFQVAGLLDRVYQDKYVWWVEDKVLELSYQRPGDEFRRQHDMVHFRSRSWKILKRERLKRAR